ncbi:hypothetical protein NZ47_01120 [Anaerovibrio lipolyticus]|uniref:Uncharacterized protein n=1 Tax=Anaerovibrio lipolyticus TaxID=82374 RepID=A0A0B2JZS2_9FIRM|nr:hypothetical protein [Anaerovibrio lipolyticus]KHM53049.1 hypothetical protein NZ47_01120 [Anaerovibrio lipolyticus]
MEKLMNKMEDMEMDKVSGGFARLRNPGFHKPKSNANSMAANVDETQMKLPIGGGHKITMEANVDETQNASGLLGSSMVGK